MKVTRTKKIEWQEKEQFTGRTTGIYTANSVEDLLHGRNLIPLSITQVPDDCILCDFCNASITEFPVPVMEGYALCPQCFKDVQQGWH